MQHYRDRLLDRHESDMCTLGENDWKLGSEAVDNLFHVETPSMMACTAA